MAITGAYTLSHLAKLSENPLEKGVIQNLLRYSEILGTLPFTDVEQLTSVAVRWTSLPTPAFRKINAGYTPSLGDTDQVSETIYPIGGEIKFDRIFDKVKNTIVDPKAMQVSMHMKALALKLNDYFINGDHASDADGFEGLKKRVANMPSRQTVGFAGDSSAPLDPTGSTANARVFMNKFDELWYKCNAGNVSAIYANEGIKWGLIKVMRYLQVSGDFLDVTKDVFGRQMLTFRGVPIHDVGLKADQSTEIITNSLTAGDGGTDSTELFFVSHNTEEGIMGIQLGGGLDVYDPLAGGELEATPTNMVRYEWVLGLSNWGSHGITRGWNIEQVSDWT